MICLLTKGKKLRVIYDSEIMGEMDYATYRACRTILKDIISGETNDLGIPQNYHYLLTDSLTEFNVEFDENQSAGVKLALLFRLQKGMHDINKIVAMTERINKFTREEAAYWLSKVLYSPTEEQRKWAVKGLRIILVGP